MKDVLLLDVTPLSLGIETLGGVMTRLIEKNTTIPTKAQQVFSTADDNQTAVTVHVLQGEREMVAGNKSLGRFDLAELPPAPRGIPQVEVAFDIDANGILNVSAKDKATGREQSIVIKASSGLSDKEIDNMVRDAESHAEEDRQARELVEARNLAENLVYSTKKSLDELGDKVEEQEKKDTEAAIAEVEKAVTGSDKELIEEKSRKLTEAAGKLAEQAYQQRAAAGADGEDSPAGAGNGAADDNVVDAEFEEVDDTRK